MFFASGNRREVRHEETALIGDLFLQSEFLIEDSYLVWEKEE